MLECNSKEARVCVIDDDPNSLAAIVSLLKQECDVVVARSGRDALRMIRQSPPDLIILDLEMPDLDGFAVCSRLKADPLTADLPVIFLTSHADEETEVRGLTAGAADFITKPARGPAVLARIQNLIRLKRMAERLRAAAQTDDLTGLPNRGRFSKVLADELLRARRQQLPVSLLMVDVDHFKAYNDHYGHLGGDGALRLVAKVLQATTHRTGDLACRYGGEEFGIILPDTDAAGARAVAAAVLTAMASAGLPHAASPVAPYVTLSIGIASGSYPAAQGGESSFQELGSDLPTELIASADAALYAAKRNGRNQAWADGADGLVWAAGDGAAARLGAKG